MGRVIDFSVTAKDYPRISQKSRRPLAYRARFLHANAVSLQVLAFCTWYITP